MPTGDESYTPEVAEEILQQLRIGRGLNAICTAESPYPHRTTVISWVRDDVDGFANRYARAREDGYRALADEMLDIADDGRNDYTEGKDGQQVLNHEHVQRSRLRIDTRKWLLSKMLPKEFGDRLDVTSNGEKTSTIVLTSGASSACADLKGSE